MSNDQSQNVKVPLWFIIVSVIALLWNLMGCGVFFAEMFAQDTMIESFPEEQREAIKGLYAAIPVWAKIGFAVGVFAGVAGCVLLLLKNKLAFPVLIASLIGVLVQNAYFLLMSDAVKIMGSSTFMMPAMVIFIGICLIAFSKWSERKGYLT